MPPPVIGFHLCSGARQQSYCLASPDEKKNEALITAKTCKLAGNRRQGIFREVNGAAAWKQNHELKSLIMIML